MSEADGEPIRFSPRRAYAIWRRVWLDMKRCAAEDGCSPLRWLPLAIWLYGRPLLEWIWCGDAGEALRRLEQARV